MDLSFSDHDLAFRDEVRAIEIAANVFSLGEQR